MFEKSLQKVFSRVFLTPGIDCYGILEFQSFKDGNKLLTSSGVSTRYRKRYSTDSKIIYQLGNQDNEHLY